MLSWNGDFETRRDDWNGEEDSSSKRWESQRVRASRVSSGPSGAQTKRALDVFETGIEIEDERHEHWKWR